MESGGQTTTVSDHENGFGYSKPEKPDGFVMIDMDRFSHVIHKGLSSNSRITLQRSLSRKGSWRTNERKIPCDTNGNDKETSTPQSPLRGSGTPEKAAALGAPVGSADHIATASTTSTSTATATGPQLHQITITAGNIAGQTENRLAVATRKNSFKRSPNSWIFDPKKIVLFFATLSSIGSILLIIFTLSMGKSTPEDTSLD